MRGRGELRMVIETEDLRTKKWTWLGLAVLAFVLVACAAGPNPAMGTAPDGDVAGFWLGLWHGFIAPITFFISLFRDSVNIYEVHNNGNWYDFGFVLGAGLLLSGGVFGRRRR